MVVRVPSALAAAMRSSLGPAGTAPDAAADGAAADGAAADGAAADGALLVPDVEQAANANAGDRERDPPCGSANRCWDNVSSDLVVAYHGTWMLPIEPSSARPALRGDGPMCAAPMAAAGRDYSVLLHLTSLVSGRQDHVRDLST